MFMSVSFCICACKCMSAGTHRNVRSLGAWVAGGCKPPNMGAGGWISGSFKNSVHSQLVKNLSIPRIKKLIDY